MAPRAGFEPATYGLEGRCTIHCATEVFGWGGWDRTTTCQVQSLMPYRLATPQFGDRGGI
jgi:hypothetical protein